MRTVYERRSDVPPWAWVSIALGILLVILVVWLVAAGNRPGQEQQDGAQPNQPPVSTAPGVTPPAPTTPQMPYSPAPNATVPSQPEKQVKVYIYERPQAAPQVVAVPQGAREPPADKGYELVDLPGQFLLDGRDWRAEPGALIMADAVTLKDSGLRVEGHWAFILADDHRPFEALYIETMPGSGKYVRYTPAH